MKNEETPDSAAKQNGTQIKLVKIPQVITLCIACITGTWGFSTTVRNIQLMQMLSKIEIIADSLNENFAADAERSVQMARTETTVEEIGKDIDALKTIMASRRQE